MAREFLPTDGQAIRHARHRAGYGSSQLAAEVGITPGHMSGIERGRRRASPGLVRRIADALGKTIDDLSPIGPAETS